MSIHKPLPVSGVYSELDHFKLKLLLLCLLNEFRPNTGKICCSVFIGSLVHTLLSMPSEKLDSLP